MLFAITFGLAITGCRQKAFGPPIDYVLPNGYHGVFSITIDQSCKQTVPLTNGHYVVTIPDNGKLTVSSVDVFRGKHVISARYKDTEESLPSGRTPGSISLRFVDFDVDTKTEIYLIGTEQEADDAWKKMRGIH